MCLRTPMQIKRPIPFFYIFSSLLIFPFTANSSQDLCHPAPNPILSQYIIGYGSLIESQSKNSTYPNTGKNLPVQVAHYQRAWLATGDSIGLSTTYLAVTENKNASFNGVIFHVPHYQAIQSFDQREKYYCRVAVSYHWLQPLNHQCLEKKAQYWLYVLQPQYSAPPSKQYPIVQSYVDIFLNGCLEIEKNFHLKDFAKECIITTHHWSQQWINDRIYPRRPFQFSPNAIVIDELLAKNLPQYFKHIHIEK